MEEISLDTASKIWNVTLGIHGETDNPVYLAQGLKETLQYKSFKIDAKTGEVISMDIKLINCPNLKND